MSWCVPRRAGSRGRWLRVTAVSKIWYCSQSPGGGPVDGLGVTDTGSRCTSASRSVQTQPGCCGGVNMCRSQSDRALRPQRKARDRRRRGRCIGCTSASHLARRSWQGLRVLEKAEHEERAATFLKDGRI